MSEPGTSAVPPQADPPYTETVEVLRRAREGDQASFDRLYRRFFPRLARWASGRLPSSARDLLDTQDIVQEVLLRALQRVEGFDPRGDRAFQSYLRRSVLNAIRDRIRRSHPRIDLDAAAADLVDAAPSPLEDAIGADNLRRYEAGLGRLAPRDREAIVARLEMQCDYEELAEVLGCPSPDAARMAVKRALLRLAEEMDS